MKNTKHDNRHVSLLDIRSQDSETTVYWHSLGFGHKQLPNWPAIMIPIIHQD